MVWGRVNKYIMTLLSMIGITILATNTCYAVDISVNNANLRSVVIGLARSEGLNVMGIDTLIGNVSAELHGISAKEAIIKLGEIKSFSVTEDGNQLIIRGNQDDKGIKEFYVVSPKHMRPDRLQEVLLPIVPKERSQVVHETNQLLLQVNKQERMRIDALLAELDKEPPQVRLKVTVFATENSYIKETGIRWSWLSLGGHADDKTGEYAGIKFGHAPSGEPYQFLVKPELQALEAEGKGCIIAEPTIMTINGEEAKILIGDKVPVLVETQHDGGTSTSVRYEEAGIRLTYTPHLTADNFIDADIEAEVSNPILVSEMKAYKITTRQAKTRVRLASGDKLVIGGLMDKRDHKQIQKIPVLSKIPLLGKLFQHARKTKDTVELMIIVEAERV